MSRKDGVKRQKSERVEYEETMAVADVAGYLESLGRALRGGILEVSDGATNFRTGIAGDVALDVEVRRRKRKTRFELTLQFRSSGDLSESPDAEAKTSEPAPAATIPDEMRF